ncbi:MAG: CHAP domain-containing protein [Olsenella sp.]|nr:CHAP domain-containing protein [Olsenella sp.]
MATASDLMAVAGREVGYSRYADPEQGTKYGRWYAELTGSPWFGTTGVPYCMMFVSWCLAQVKTGCVGTPSAACSPSMRAARAAGKLKHIEAGSFGDVVYFDWSRGGYTSNNADHVGFIRWVDTVNRLAYTREGNVSGCVKDCVRDFADIVGCVTPDYEEDEVTNEDIQKIAKAVIAAQIDYKNGADDSPHKASLGSRVGYIDYITHTIIRKLDEILAALRK